MTPIARYADLDGASVLITGGGSGIGAALTEGFVRQGSKVAFIDIADEASAALCDRLEAAGLPRPLYLKADLRDIEALQQAAARAADAHGAVTVLVNNAALDARHDVADVTEEFWDNNQAINLRPVFFSVQAVLPGMKAAGHGAIVNFTSTSFMINSPDMPSYTAAKAGIVGLSKGLARRLGEHNIRINSIAPGWVLTERQRKLWVTPETLGAHLDRQSIRREMTAEDMVGPCLFLASEASTMLTAQTIIVDGGVL